MKKVILIILLLSIFNFGGVLAGVCNLNVSLLNQDPYPAIQGDSVKIVFQVKGVESADCKTVKFELIEKYPITLLPGQKSTYIIESGTFTKDYESFFIAPYEVKVSEDALDGDNPIEVKYGSDSNTGFETKQFDLNIQDTRADFEVYVKDYNPLEKIISFEILNIAESDVEALAIQIPKQKNIEVKGASVNIVGDLDSNEYTTADFEAMPKKGEIQLNIFYSDGINKRRNLTKTVFYNPEYFQGRKKYEKEQPIKLYFLFAGIILFGFYFVYKKYKKNKLKSHRK